MYERNYHRQVLKTPEEGDKKTAKRSPLKRILAVAIILTIFFSIGYAIRSPRLQIETITVEGGEVIDSQDIESSVMDMLAGKFLWIFPRTSTLLVQTETIEKKIKEEFSRIDTVTVKRDSAQGLIVTINEYHGAFLWCADIDQCFFMNKNGVVYSSAPVFSGTAYAKVFSGTELQALPFEGLRSDQISFIGTLESRLTAIDIIPSEFHFINSRELRVDFLHNKENSQFIVDPTVAVETSLDYLFSGLRTEPLASSFHDINKKLLYIDVRYPNNIVYKFAPSAEQAE